jgi:hypothetical protein
MDSRRERGEVRYLSLIAQALLTLCNSEDLYRGDTTASTLAQQIYDVRGMLSTVSGGSDIQVGHVDTWTAWVDSANTAVITACEQQCQLYRPGLQSILGIGAERQKCCQWRRQRRMGLGD